MAERVRDFDWSRTPLGPMADWPQSLKTAVSICLDSRFAMMIWWGPQLTNIYNDAYVPTLGKKHSDALGRSGPELWSDVWDTIKPQVDAVFNEGRATWNDRVHLVMDRNGAPEDTWFTWSYSPLRDETGIVQGLLNVVIEETDRVVSERERQRLVEERLKADKQARTILTSITDAFFALDRQWRFSYVNPRCEQVLNCQPGELEGVSLWEKYPGLEDTEFETTYRNAMERQIEGSFTAFYPGHQRWYEVHCYPSSDGISVYFRDVTEQKSVDEELKRSREHLRAVFDSAGSGLYVMGPDSLCTYMNVAGATMLGYTPDELVGRSLHEVIHHHRVDGSPYPISDCHIARSAKSGVNAQVDDEAFWHKDGSAVLVRYSASPILVNGKSEGAVVTFTDMTERVRVEKALRDQDERNRAVLASLDEGISLHDERGTIIMANAGAERILGLTLNQMLGIDSFNPHWKGVGEDGVELRGDQHPPQIAIRTGEPVTNMVMGINHADGRLVWVSVTSIVLKDAATGRVTGAVTSFVDITDRRRAEKEREALFAREREARLASEQAGQMKDEFLATLSHELRTPLSAILGWSQILRRADTKPATLTEGLQTIERNARAQTKIIDDLLDMSRIINGKVSIDAQRINLSTVVRDAIATVMPTATAKGIEIIFAQPPTARHPILGDANRLQQVFWNLLSNAAKFTPRGGGAIEVRLDQRHSQWQVDIIDRGEGIGEKFLPFVFDRFRQADASTTRRHGGLGLGLAIAKQLVEIHGGKVRVKSDGVGKGSTFTVSLPVRVVHDDPVRANSDAPASVTESTLDGVAVSVREGAAWDISLSDDIRGKTILVVDDEPDARALLRQLLADCQADVLVAASADEAITLIKANRPDVLVSDIGMPGEDGYALLKRVRSLPSDQGGQTPAIALTAYARAEDRMKAVRAGFQMHVPKPVEPAELMTMIATLVSK